MFLNLQHQKDERISHSSKSKAETVLLLRTVGKPIGTYFPPVSLKKAGRGLEYDTTYGSIRSERLYRSYQWKSKPDFIDTLPVESRDCEWHKQISSCLWHLMINNCKMNEKSLECWFYIGNLLDLKNPLDTFKDCKRIDWFLPTLWKPAQNTSEFLLWAVRRSKELSRSSHEGQGNESS